MTMIETPYEHIVINDERTPIIDGTTMKVIELVLEQQAYGWSAEECYFQHPYLTLGQIYSALAYYWDHKADLDQDIAQRYENIVHLQRAMPLSPLIARIKAAEGQV